MVKFTASPLPPCAGPYMAIIAALSWESLLFAVMQTRAKRYGSAVHGFIHFNSLAEIRCSVRALEDVAIAMRQAVKEEKEPWDLRSYLMVAAVVVSFLAVKLYHFYQTGNAL